MKIIKKEYEDYDDEVVVEGNSNVVLVLEKKLKEKIDYLSTDYTKSEIGGFLTYKEIVKDEDGDVTIILDDLLIPPQEATTGEVDVDGNGQIEMFKEYGTEKCQKIIGHWHSHHTLGSFFSSEDEKMMKSYSENKPFRIFVVSSEGKHLIRLVLKSSFNTIPIELIIENVEYRVEIDDSIKKEMEEEIKKKVKEPVVVTTTRCYPNSNSNNGIKKLKKEISMRIKYLQHQNHKVRVEKVFKTYADMIEEEFKILKPTIEKVDEQHFDVVVELGDRNKAKEFMSDVKAFLLKQLMLEREKAEEVQSSGEEVDNQLEEYLSELDEEELDEYERNKSGLYGSRRCDWSHYRNKESETPQEKLQRDFYSGHSHMDYSY